MTEHSRSISSGVGFDTASATPVRGPLYAQLAARILGNRLDKQLAVGARGAAGSALAIRAALLESEKERHAIARTLRRAVVESREGRPLPSTSIPVDIHNIAAAEDVIDAITLRLHSPRHVGARGMARLRLLISDGSGPMYQHGGGDLIGRLRAALAAL